MCGISEISMTSSLRIRNDFRQLLNLLLRPSKGTELEPQVSTAAIYIRNAPASLTLFLAIFLALLSLLFLSSSMIRRS